MSRRAAARCALHCRWGDVRNPRDLCHLMGLGSPSDRHKIGPLKFLDGFIRLCCSNSPRLSAQGQSNPYWFSLTLETGKSELLLPRNYCSSASRVPEYHQMTIDFLAGRLNCRQENCSLAWPHVVKKRKSAKSHLKAPVCLADPAHAEYQRDLYFHGQQQASASSLRNVN